MANINAVEETTVFDRAVDDLEEALADVPDVPTYDQLFAANDALNTTFDRTQAHYQTFKVALTPQDRMERTMHLNSLQMKLDALKGRLRAKQIEIARPHQPQPGAGILPPAPVQRTAKLPKLILPTYSGDPELYQEFAQRFQASVGDNMTLSGIDKLQYLKGQVSGVAKTLLDSIPLTNANYAAAVELLKKHFGEPPIIQQTALERLQALEPVVSIYPIANVRHQLATVQAKLLTLQQTNLDIVACGPLLFDIIKNKFPGAMTLMFLRVKTPAERTLANLLEYLTEDILRIESNDAEKKHKKKDETDKGSSKSSFMPSQPKHVAGKHFASNTFVSSTASPVPKPCVFCGLADHKAVNCLKVPQVEARREILRKAKRCFNCLAMGHNVNNCKNSLSCFRCQKRHHTAIHINTVQTTVPPPVTEEVQTALAGCHFVIGETFFPTFQATARAGRQSCSVRGILDTASNKTFITKALQDKLKLKSIGTVTMRIATFTDDSPDLQTLPVCRLSLSSRFGGAELHLEVTVVNMLPKNKGVTDAATIDLIKATNRPLGIDLPVTGDDTDVLVGQDYLWAIRREGEEPLTEWATLQNSIFGWLFSGRAVNTKERSLRNVVMTAACETPQTDINKLWDLEALGIQDNLWEDSKFLQDFTSKITRTKDGRYVVPLPFNDKISLLNSNRQATLMQLASMIKRLFQNKDKLNAYDAAITAYEKEGSAKHVDETAATTNPLYYMPHSSVERKEHLTTKLRIVFNASSPQKGLSLNDCLRDGPNLNPYLLNLLIAFRIYKTPIVADVRKAFLQIEVAEDCQDVLRYFWVDLQRFHNNTFTWSGFIQALRCLKMVVVAFGVNSSPFLLAVVIRKHLQDTVTDEPQLALELDQQMYVDDLVSGDIDDISAFQKSKRISEIFEQAKLPLVKWMTHAATLQQMWKDKGFHVRTKEDGQTLEQEKVLGIIWELSTDQLRITIPKCDSELINKRDFLSFLAAIYDPLGLLSPVLIQGKLLLQITWKENLGWTSQLPEPLKQEMFQWQQDMQHLQTFTIPRWIQWEGNQALALEVYCDASPMAFGCTVYVKTGSGTKTLLAAKSRLAPLKKMLTLPRLELMGAVVAAKFTTSLLSALPLSMKPEKVTYRTDSQIVLAWLMASDRKWKPFVSNRVEEILALTKVEDWGYVKSEDNPADLLTHSAKAETFKALTRWWNGPENSDLFLDVHSVQLPAEEEVKTTVSVVVDKTEEEWMEKRFYDLTLLCRALARCLRWKAVLSKSKKLSTVLTVKETKWMCHLLIRRAQELWYGEERTLVQQEKPLAKSELQQLNCFIAPDDLLRVGGRLQHATIPYDQKHPIVLPPKAWITRLIVQQKHKQMCHANVSDVLHALRAKYWIPRGRQTVNSILQKCLICQKHRAKPITMIEAPVVPKRVTPAIPFRYVGLDFCGPFLIRMGKKLVKAYILLVTCMVIRAVHLEVVSSLTTASFLLAFRRFVALRGCPEEIISDNAATLGLGSKQLDSWASITSANDVHAYLHEHKISWTFIPVRTPHFGGFYERLIGIAKTLLRKVSQKYPIDMEEFVTIVYDTGAIMNSRPLTYVSEDPSELRPLSPNSFLTGGMPFMTLKNNPFQRLPGGKELRKLNRRRIQIVNYLWKRWIESYLLSTRYFHERKGGLYTTPLAVGDVVLLQQEHAHPFWWPMGRVLNLFQGKDKVVRVVELKMGDGTVTQRSVRHVCRLELSDPEKGHLLAGQLCRETNPTVEESMPADQS